MKKTLKKGFTIVELVIVIAVIAILAAVLIPTFVSVVNKANVSNDTALVRNINTVLATEEVTDGKPATMHDALKMAENGGFDVSKLTPRSTGDIVWDSTTNRFALVDGDKTVYSDGDKQISKNATVWKIVENENDAKNNTEYSSYVKGNGNLGDIEVTTGIDLGENKASGVTYKGGATEKTVTIRTIGNTALTVDAINDTVNHYGEASSVDIKAVKGESYHEYGKVGFIGVTNGRLAVESTAKVITVYAAASTAKIDNNAGVIENAYKANGVSASGNVNLTALSADQTVVSIKTEALYQYNAAVKVGNVYYSTLREALDKVESKFGEGYLVSGNAKFVLLKDLRDDGIVIASNSKVEIDFNGFTYEVDGTVGSSSTTTNGFQLLKDSTIVMKNGTLKSATAYILIQNYANLTLDNMVIDGRELDSNNSLGITYTLSNSNGNVVIHNTQILARDNMFAFDVCRYSTYESVFVNVTGESVVSGKIEIYASNSEAKKGFGLTIESGDFSKATIKVDNTVKSLIETNIIKKKSNITLSVSAGYEWSTAENGYQKLIKKSA